MCFISEKNKNKIWEPKDWSRICSAHFEGGEKSNDPRKVSYNPTIFPEIYGQKKINPSKAERLIARNKKKEESISVINQADENDDEFVDELFICLNKKTKEIGIQTDPVFDHNERENFTILFCSTDNNNVSTQTTIRIIT